MKHRLKPYVRVGIGIYDVAGYIAQLRDGELVICSGVESVYCVRELLTLGLACWNPSTPDAEAATRAKVHPTGSESLQKPVP